MVWHQAPYVLRLRKINIYIIIAITVWLYLNQPLLTEKYVNSCYCIP